MDGQDQNQQEQAGSNHLKSETDLAEGGTENGEQQRDVRPNEIKGQKDGLPETTSVEEVIQGIQGIDNESASQGVEVRDAKEEKSDDKTEDVEKRGEEEEPVAASESESDKQIETQNDTTEEKECAEPAAVTESVPEDDSKEGKGDDIVTADNTADEEHGELNQSTEGSDAKQTNEDDPEASGISEGNMKAKEDNQEPEELAGAQKIPQASDSIANERQLTDDKPQEDQPSASIPDDGESQRVGQDSELNESIVDDRKEAQSGYSDLDDQGKVEGVGYKVETDDIQTPKVVAIKKEDDVPIQDFTTLASHEQTERSETEVPDEEMQPAVEEGEKVESQVHEEQELQDKSNDNAENSGLESEDSQGNGVPSLPDDTTSSDVQVLEAEDEEILKLEPEQQNRDFPAGDTNQVLPELAPTMVEEEKVGVEQDLAYFSEPLDKQHEKSEMDKDDVVQTVEVDLEDHVVSGQEHVLASSEETTIKSEDDTINEVSQPNISKTDETEYSATDEGHSKSEELLGPEDRHSPTEEIDRTATTITDDQSIGQTEALMTEQPKDIESPELPEESRKDILTESKVMSQEVKEQTTSQESTGDAFTSQAELQDDQEHVCQPLEAESLATSLTDVQDDENNLVDHQKLSTSDGLGVEEKENETVSANLPTPKEAEVEIVRLIAAEQYAAPPAVDEVEPHKESKGEGVEEKVITESEETRSIDVLPKASESEHKNTQPDEESRDDTNQGKEFIPTDEEEAQSESPHDMSSMKTPLLGESPTEKKPIFQEESESIRPGGAAIIPSTEEFEQPEASGQDEKTPLVKTSKDGSKTYGTSDKDVEQKKSAPSGLFARIRTLVHAYCIIL